MTIVQDLLLAADLAEKLQTDQIALVDAMQVYSDKRESTARKIAELMGKEIDDVLAELPPVPRPRKGKVGNEAPEPGAAADAFPPVEPTPQEQA